MGTPLRIILGLGLAALSGVLLTLSFPPYDLWPLVLVGFVPATVAQHRIMPRQLSGVAFGVGLGAFFWGYFGPMFANTVWFMEWLPLIVAVIAAILSSSSRAFHERTHYRWFVLEGAVVWVGIEAIRGFAPVVGTGGFVAYALYSQPWLLQPVGIFSIYGLSLLVMLANYALALGVLAWLDRRAILGFGGLAAPLRRRLALYWLAGIASILILWSALGLTMLGQSSVAGSSVKVAAIQPGNSPNQQTQTGTLLEQTRQAASQDAQLVVWPEGALNYDPRLVHTDDFTSLVRETGVYLVLGYGVHTPAGWRNEAILLTPQGEFLAPYGKDHPVVWLGETSLTGGTYPTHDTALGTLGTIICYDLNFTDTARKMAANGAQVIAVPSNDWPALATRQYSNLALRAVENRVTLIKADTQYDSAIIDPAGRIVSSAISTQPLRTILMATVPIGKADAPLIRLGDWVGWLCIAGILAFMVLNFIITRRTRHLTLTAAAPSNEAPLNPTDVVADKALVGTRSRP